MLFYAEYLKQQIIGAIRSSDRFSHKNSPRITPTTKDKFKVATAVLVEDGVLTNEERDEIGKLVDVRNAIAHSIHEMTYDVSRDSYNRQRLEFEQSKYDYGALKRIKYFYGELSKRMMSKYVQEISMDGLLFESAEKTYEVELKHLSKKINAQMEARQKKMGVLKKELSLVGTEFESNENHPTFHPANVARNGNLNKRGVEVCFRLFDIGKRPIVVAYLMYISVKAARKRHKQWVKAGGITRKRIEIESPFRRLERETDDKRY